MKISLDLDVKLSVTMHGVEIPLESLPPLLRESIIGQIVTQYLDPPKHAPQPESISDVFAPTHLSPFAIPQRQKMSDTWIVKACNAIGKPATPRQIYQKLVSMGFESKAENPVKSIYRDLSRYPERFLRIKTDNHSLWTTRETASGKDLIAAAQEAKQASGIRMAAREYALVALQSEGRPLDAGVLSQKMADMGWPNESPTAPKRRKAAHVALWRYKDEFLFVNGKWGLAEWGAGAWEGKPNQKVESSLPFDGMDEESPSQRGHITPEELAAKEEAFLASRQH